MVSAVRIETLQTISQANSSVLPSTKPGGFQSR
jgi:hypothetical protein